MSRKIVAVLGVLWLLSGSVAGAEVQPRLPGRKKLIEYGWDVPTPVYVAANLAAMEKRPFDGVIMRLSGKQYGTVFRGGKWDEAEYAPDMEALKKIAWGTFRDNFIMIYAASEMDWFSDQDWDGVLSNVGIMAKAAQAGRCGLAFDPEPYGKTPWKFSEQAHAQTKSFAEYQAKVRQRGSQFITAVQQHLPEAVLLTLFSYSIFPEIAEQPDPVKRGQALEQHGYGLYAAFLAGIMDALGPGLTLVDGNELSYYYAGYEPFYVSYHRMRRPSLSLAPPEHAAKFMLQTQAGQALYFDYLFAATPSKDIPSVFMNDQERLKWWEHNVYWALKSSDEYVWLYSEHMNWWKNEGLPAGMEQAVLSARDKIAQQKPLGFDLRAIMEAAGKRKAEAAKQAAGK